ncbi:MAG: VWA domain-containing protein [Pseudomonadota bacterium]
MSGWHFLRPEWCLLLPFALAALGLFHRGRAASGRWRSLVDEALQPYVLTGGREPRAWLLPIAQGLALTALIVALAGPVKDRLPQPVYKNGAALVIALDLSRSMNARDIVPTRLERARLKVRDLLDQRDQGDTALIVFAGDAFTVTPLTDDTATIEAMLGSLTTRTIPRQGSLIAPALVRAGRLLDDAGARGGRVLVLTDGAADHGKAIKAAQDLAARDIRVSILGIGTPDGDVVRNTAGELVKDGRGQIVVARLDAPGLASISTAGNGRFAMLSADDADLSGLLGDVERTLTDGVLSEDFETDVWREVGPLIVLMCLPVIAFMFRRGAVVMLAAVVLVPALDARAGIWQDFWATNDQQAARRFADEEYAAAAEQFQDPAWAAAAAYRAGDYSRAASLLDGIKEPEALYNRGNALAYAGDIDGARAAYESALDLMPDHEDAQHNLDLLNQLPPPQSQDSESGESDQDSPPSDDELGSSPQNGESGDDGGAGGDGASGADQSGANGDQQGDPPPSRGDPGEGEDASDEAGEQDDESRNAESGEPQNGEGEKDEQQSASAVGDGSDETERDLAAEQWLRQVPDDPGGLLRRKFQQQYRLRYEGQPEETEPW